MNRMSGDVGVSMRRESRILDELRYRPSLEIETETNMSRMLLGFAATHLRDSRVIFNS